MDEPGGKSTVKRLFFCHGSDGHKPGDQGKKDKKGQTCFGKRKCQCQAACQCWKIFTQNTIVFFVHHHYYLILYKKIVILNS